MTTARLLFAAAALSLAIGQGVDAANGASRLQLSGRSITVDAPARFAAAGKSGGGTDLAVTVTNTSSRAFAVSPSDFALSAQGDMFGSSAGGLPVTIAPRRSSLIRLRFRAPDAAVAQAAVVYRTRGTDASSAVPAPRTAAFAASPSITTFLLLHGAAEPWGLALDRRGDVWFAQPGCDFESTCGPGTPPGQIGELKPRTHRVVFYRLPRIRGNQPIFLAFDPSGNLWFTTPNNSRIGEFRPWTRKFIGQWRLTAGSGPWDLTYSNGKLWYTDHLGSAVGNFSPATHRHRDFPTPSPHSNPYGIAADAGRIWFTENNSAVDRVAVLDPRKRRNAISEYPIVEPLSGTPHMIAIGPGGHPWWTEGFANTIGTLDPRSATPGSCAPTPSGACQGVQRFALPTTGPCASYGTHVSGIAIRRGRLWLDDSLSAEVGSFDPGSGAFALDTLSGCNDHPDDGLALDSAGRVWFGEEFGSAIGELRP